MTGDARFEDGDERPLRLRAETIEDLGVIAALVQDAVLTGADTRWEPKRRRLSFLLNRFRWEDRAAAEARGRPYERVRSVLTIDSVLQVASQGIERGNPDAVLSVLDLVWMGGEDVSGRVELVLAGDGAIRAVAECLDVTLADVTRPYRAPSGRMPGHPD